MRLGSLKVIGTDTNRSTTHDFLLMFHSNHQPISHCFWDIRRFQSKITKFPTLQGLRVFYAPSDGVPLEIGYWCKGLKKLVMGLPDGRKSFNIGLAI